MNPIIKIQNLTVVYDKGMPSEVKALDGVNVNIYPEEFVIIFGPSGCGKSTLLYVMAGIERSIETTSQVWIKNKDLVKMTKEELILFHRESMGMVFQAFNLISNLNVLQNVALPQVFAGVDSNIRIKKAKAMLARLNISQYASRFPQQLSGGQQQRVGIARALVNDTDIILADEPTGNLDSENALNVINLLQNLSKQEKKTVVMVTHESQYIKYGTKIVYVKDGKVLKEEKINQESAYSQKKEKEAENLKKDEETEIKIPEQEKNFEAKKDPEKNEEKIKTEQKTKFEPKNTEKEKISPALEDYKHLLEEKEISAPKEIPLLSSDCEAPPLETQGVSNIVSYFGLKAELSEEEDNRLKILLSDFFNGRISENELKEKLDLPFNHGGAGFYRQKAEKFSQEIAEIKNIRELISNAKKENLERAAKIFISWLFKEYKGEHISEQKYKKIETLALKIIENKIDNKIFMAELDKPENEGGAGLNSLTALNIAKKTEMVIIPAVKPVA